MARNAWLKKRTLAGMLVEKRMRTQGRAEAVVSGVDPVKHALRPEQERHLAHRIDCIIEALLARISAGEFTNGEDGKPPLWQIDMTVATLEEIREQIGAPPRHNEPRYGTWAMLIDSWNTRPDREYTEIIRVGDIWECLKKGSPIDPASWQTTYDIPV